MREQPSREEFLSRVFMIAKDVIRDYENEIIREFHKVGEEDAVVELRRTLTRTMELMDLALLSELFPDTKQVVIESIRDGSYEDSAGNLDLDME